MLYGNQEIDDAMLETIQFLDAINVKKYLSPGKDLYDVIDEIEEEYGDSLEDSDTFQGCVFNWMSPDEFADYIEKKYNIRVIEDVKISYRIGGCIDGTDA